MMDADSLLLKLRNAMDEKLRTLKRQTVISEADGLSMRLVTDYLRNAKPALQSAFIAACRDTFKGDPKC